MSAPSTPSILKFPAVSNAPMAFQVHRGVATRQELLDLWAVVKAADAKLRPEPVPPAPRRSARERARTAWGSGHAA